MSKEEVLTAIDCHILRNPDDKFRCPDCPYRDPSIFCMNRLLQDVRQLLDPQEVEKDDE